MHRSSLWLKPIYSLLLCQCIYCWNSRNPHVYTEEKAQKRAFVMTLCQVTVSPRWELGVSYPYCRVMWLLDSMCVCILAKLQKKSCWWISSDFYSWTWIIIISFTNDFLIFCYYNYVDTWNFRISANKTFTIFFSEQFYVKSYKMCGILEKTADKSVSLILKQLDWLEVLWPLFTECPRMCFQWISLADFTQGFRLSPVSGWVIGSNWKFLSQLSFGLKSVS